MADRWRLYASALVAAYLLLGTALWLPAALLWRTGELWPANWIVDYQRRTAGLWASGLLQNEAEYKQALYERVEPQVVAIGSSRSLQMREDMFSASFVNMGRGLDLLHADKELRMLTNRHAPQLVIWGFDYWLLAEQAWWRDTDYFKRRDRLVSLATTGKATPDLVPRQILSIWNLLGSKVLPADAVKALIRGSAYPGPRVGLEAALTNNGGYGPDGSAYTFSAYETPRSQYKKLQDKLRQQRDIYQLDPNEVVSQELAQRFETAIAGLKQRGVAVVLYTVPLPKKSIDLIAARPDLAGYFSTVRTTLTAIAAKSGAEFYDQLDPTAAGVTESEFIDPIHPGEVAVAEILLDMVNRGSSLRNFLNIEALTKVVRENRQMPTANREFYTRFGISRTE